MYNVPAMLQFNSVEYALGSNPDKHQTKVWERKVESAHPNYLSCRMNMFSNYGRTRMSINLT